MLSEVTLLHAAVIDGVVTCINFLSSGINLKLE